LSEFWVAHQLVDKGKSMMNKSRRHFFLFGKRLSLLMAAIYFGNLSLKKSEGQDKFIIVNGWVLKKSDLI